MKNILIKNATIVPMSIGSEDPQKYYLGHVAIRGNRIAFVGAAEQCAEQLAAFEAECGADLEVIDGTDRVVIPGLINLHNHVSMTLMRSYADDMELMPWLTELIWPLEAKLTEEDIVAGAKLGMAEMLLGGTTTYVDMYWKAPAIARATREMGMRGVICPTVIGTDTSNFEQETSELIESITRDGDGLIRVMLAPHAPYTCPPETLKIVMELCERYGIGVKIHVSETQTEQETIREQYGKTPIEHLYELGLFNYPALAAHCVYVSESDMLLMSKCGVSVAHNPQSNMKLASGIAPVAAMLKAGVNVGIGTDGPSSNNDLDMWEEMRTASLLQKVATGDPCALSAYEVLSMATLGGAKAIGMEGELGVLKAGALADVVVLRTDRPHLVPRHDVISNLIYSAKASDVDTVIVNGQVQVRSSELCNVDWPALRSHVEGCVEALLQR